MAAKGGKFITCRAAIAWQPQKPLVIEEIQVAPPKAHEVRIRVIASGVCHSDAVPLNGEDKQALFPVILGHEAAGIVESIGEDVTDFQIGDHVIPLSVPQCRQCKMCKSGKTNMCEKIRDMPTVGGKGAMMDGTMRFSCRGQPIYHFMAASTFTEYTVIDDIALAKINKQAPLDKVCLLGCGIPTGYGAAINTAKVEPGSTCAVWGLGGVGLACVMGCKRAGATKIYGIDINPAKAELGKIFGMTDFINPNEIEGKIQQHLLKLTNGGLDYTFESCGNINTMRAALESTHRGWGTSVIIGVPPSGHEVSIVPFQLIAGRWWTGSALGGYRVEDIPKLVEEYLNKQIMVDEFITHTMKLVDINEAFDLMRSGKSLRSVINIA